MPIHNFNGKTPMIDPTVYVASSATIVGDVVIGTNSSIWPNAVIRGDLNKVRMGSKVNIQDNVVIDAKKSGIVSLGDNVSIGHGAILHGCQLGHNIIIGMGAIIMEEVTISDWVIVGAGSVLTQKTHVPSNSIVMGIPGQIIRSLLTQEKESILQNTEEYVALAQQYLRLKI